MGNVEFDPCSVLTSPMHLNFSEDAGNSDDLEEKIVLFLSATGVHLQDTISWPPITWIPTASACIGY